MVNLRRENKSKLRSVAQSAYFVQNDVKRFTSNYHANGCQVLPQNLQTCQNNSRHRRICNCANSFHNMQFSRSALGDMLSDRKNMSFGGRAIENALAILIKIRQINIFSQCSCQYTCQFFEIYFKFSFH